MRKSVAKQGQPSGNDVTTEKTAAHAHEDRAHESVANRCVSQAKKTLHLLAKVRIGDIPDALGLKAKGKKAEQCKECEPLHKTQKKEVSRKISPELPSFRMLCRQLCSKWSDVLRRSFATIQDHTLLPRRHRQQAAC